MASRSKKKHRGYSAETIRKAVQKLNEQIAFYRSMDPHELAIVFSSGNKKIGRVLNVSTAPIITCANCSGCMHYCYDIKAVLQYGNVLKARARNTALLMTDRDRFFAQIDKKMSRRRYNKYFRWHVAGEIIDMDYFDRMVENARNHPDFTIWTYTKNYAVVNAWIAAHGGTKEAIPSNFIVMFSEWNGMAIVNPYGLPEFRVRMDPSDPAPAPFKCPGNCDWCKEHHRGCIAGENTFADLH